MDSDMKCIKCGRTFRKKGALAQHIPRCADNTNTNPTNTCHLCNQSYDTYSGLRQHIRRKHPAEYSAELEAGLRQPEVDILHTIASIECEIPKGQPFLKRMAEATGLTVDQVRHRRRHPQYAAIKAAQINAENTPYSPRPGPSTASTESPPATRTRTRTVMHNTRNHPPPVSPPDDQPTNTASSIRSVGQENFTFLEQLIERAPGYQQEMSHLLSLLREQANKAALLSALDQLTKVILDVPKPNRNRIHNAGNNNNYGLAKKTTGSRASHYKKTQDLYSKNPKALAEIILAGKSLDEQAICPTMPDIENHFGQIFSSPSPADNEPVTCIGEEDEWLPITPEEITLAKTNWRKSSPGLDGATVNDIKRLDNTVLSFIFNIIVLTHIKPSAWNQIKTILVPKGKYTTNPNDWRPISISSAPLRLLHRILAKRLNDHVSLNGHQRGFTRTDGVLINTITLEAFIRMRAEASKPYTVVSLDLSKAFDSVSHHAIRRATKRFRINPLLSSYILSDLSEAWTNIHSKKMVSQPIKFNRGVKQGDPLSPIIFNMIMDELIAKIDSKFKGGSLSDSERVSIMAFADDLILLSDDETTSQVMLNETSVFLRHRGLAINTIKSRALSVQILRKKTITRSVPFFANRRRSDPYGHGYQHNKISGPLLYAHGSYQTPPGRDPDMASEYSPGLLKTAPEV